MTTQYTPDAGIPYPQADDEPWDVPIIASILAVDAMVAIGSLAVRPTAPGATSALPSTTLAVDIASGVFLDASGTAVTYAGASNHAVAASSTVRLWLTDAGVLASGASYPAATQFVPLATVVTSGTGVTAISDDRVVWRSYGGSSAGYVAKAGDTLADPSNFVLGTTTGTKIGTGSTQKLGFYGATPIVRPANTSDLRALLINLGLLGSGGANPLDLNGGTLVGGVRFPVTVVTGNTTLTTIGLVKVTIASNVVITLPDATTWAGGVLVFKRTDAAGNTCTVQRAGTDTLDGGTSNTSLSAQWTTLRLIAASGAWYVI